MAELGIIASVVQLADLGVRLSLRLYTFGETVANADKSIISISKDVSLTSSVLKELGQSLEKGQETRICSENAFQTADGIVKECLEVFNSMDKALTRSMSRLGLQEGGKKAKTVAALERLKWPFLQPKMQLLRSNLERLKSTLLLMLNVLIYARQVADKNEPQSVIDSQRALIEDLARSNMEYSRKYKDVALAIEASQSKEVESSQSAKGPSARVSRSINAANSVVNDLPEKTDIPKSRDLFLEKQQKAQGLKVGEVMEEMLSHYCDLVNNLLEEVDSAKYRIRKDLRSRIRDDVVHTHKREREYLRTKYGDEKLKQAFSGSALNLVESDIVALESRTTKTTTPVAEIIEPNKRPYESQLKGRRFDVGAHLIETSQKAHVRTTRKDGSLSSSLKSFLKTYFRLPFLHINSKVSQRLQGVVRRRRNQFGNNLYEEQQELLAHGGQITRKPDTNHEETSATVPGLTFETADASLAGWRAENSLDWNGPGQRLDGSVSAQHGSSNVGGDLESRSLDGMLLHGPQFVASYSEQDIDDLVSHMVESSSVNEGDPTIEEQQRRDNRSVKIIKRHISEHGSIDLSQSDHATSRLHMEASSFSPPKLPDIILNCYRNSSPDYEIDSRSSQGDLPMPKVQNMVDDLLAQWTTLKPEFY